MKPLAKYIIESNTSNPFDAIDMSDWKWPRYGIPDERLKICHETVTHWAWEYYCKEHGIKDYKLAILEDTYIKYLESATNWDASKMETDYKRLVRNVKSPNGSFDRDTPQGWWYFVWCAIEKMK